MKITHSEKSCFKFCRRQWELNYVKLLKPQRNSAKLILGSAVHKWLENYLITLDPDLGPYKRAFLNEAMAKGIDLLDPELQEAMKLGEAMCYGFPDWHIHDDTYWPESVEQQFEVPILEEGLFVGKVDAIVREPNGLWVVEHKTAAQFPTLEYLNMDEQVTGYIWAIQKVYDEPVLGCIYDVLRKQAPSSRVKSPLYMRKRLTRTPQQLLAFERDLENIYRDMTDKPRIYRNYSRDCSWRCQYADLCISDDARAGYIVRDTKHSELEAEGDAD